MVIAFITEHKDHRVGDGLRWGVEPLCDVLTAVSYTHLTLPTSELV